MSQKQRRTDSGPQQNLRTQVSNRKGAGNLQEDSRGINEQKYLRVKTRDEHWFQ